MRDRFRQVCTLVLSLLLLTVGFADAAHANGLPTRIDEGPSPMIVPDNDSGIEVLSEELTYDFRPDTVDKDWPFVTAKYKMKNAKPQDTKMDVMFLYLAEASNLQVFWNGQEVPTSVPQWTDLLELDVWNMPMGFFQYKGYEMHWLDLSSGEADTVHRVQPNGVKSVLFPISLKANEQGELLVRYHQTQASCENCRSSWRLINHYTYLLSPASHWVSFRDLTIKVLVPEDYKIATEPALQEVSNEYGERVLSQHFDTLPEGEFHLSLKKPQPLPWGAIFSVVLPLLMLVAGLVALVKFYKKKYGLEGKSNGRD